MSGSPSSKKTAGGFNNKLFVTADGGSTLIAVDARTGHTVWESKVPEPWRLAGQAPLVANGKVVVTMI